MKKKDTQNAKPHGARTDAEILREYEVHGTRCGTSRRRSESPGKQPIAAAKTGRREREVEADMGFALMASGDCGENQSHTSVLQ